MEEGKFAIVKESIEHGIKGYNIDNIVTKLTEEEIKSLCFGTSYNTWNKETQNKYNKTIEKLKKVIK